MTENPEKKSNLIASLREGIAVVQMILFKELKEKLTKDLPLKEQKFLSMLAGSITNEVFATQNPEKTFTVFRDDNRGFIEQELLNMRADMPTLCEKITDALRIQTLCDHQEGKDSSKTLIRAKGFGFLVEERETPLPSIFMTTVRLLGEEHSLIIPPVQITPEQDHSIVN